MRRIGVLVLMGALFLFPVTAVGQDVAVTEIYKTKLSVYSEASGETKIAQVLEDDVALPALQLGNESDYGFIMVRFIFKDSSKNANPRMDQCGFLSKRTNGVVRIL